MKFDVYYNFGEEIKTEDGAIKETSNRKRISSIDLDALKKEVETALTSIPENATNFYMTIEKTYEEQLDDMLKSI